MVVVVVGGQLKELHIKQLKGEALAEVVWRGVVEHEGPVLAYALHISKSTISILRVLAVYVRHQRQGKQATNCDFFGF